MRRAAASFAVLLVVSACGTTTFSSSAVKDCHTSADCGSGQSCLFSVYESCGVAGVCVASPDGSACIQQTACGCNGATVSVCLIDGNAPSPIESLGSCDGATQQGFDASVPPTDAAPPPPNTPDANDSSVPVTPEDSGSEDSAPGVDAADAAPVPVEGSLGWPCTSSSQCTDSAYNQCHTVAGGGSKICTYPCSADPTCQPPSDGFCDTNSYCALH